VARWCGAESVAFHAAFYMGDSPEDTYKAVKKYLTEVMNELKQEGNKVLMRPEVFWETYTMGDTG